MSDMNQSDLVAPAADGEPVAEPVAPEAPALVPVEAPPAAEPAVEAPAPSPAVPVLAQVASSASPTQAPEVDESEDDEDETPVSLEDAARAVVLFVKAHRTVGDADLGSALADLEAALDAQA